MIAPELASKLLDEVLYERVLAFVHLPGLFAFEQELWFELQELGVAKAPDVAKAMVDAALARAIEDPRRYIDIKPFGMDCDLCDEEAHERTRSKRRKPA